MTISGNMPDIESFLALPDAEIARVAPSTVLFAPAGTRRRAALDNIPSEQYTAWAIQKLGHTVQLFFQLGVRHVIVPFLAPGQLQEPEENYRNNIIGWVAKQTTSQDLEQISKNYNYRLRLIGPATKSSEALFSAANTLLGRPCTEGLPTLWMYVVQFEDEPWREVLNIAASHAVTEREEIVKLLYGEVIPSVELYIGFGRFVLHPRLLPLSLFDRDVQCYWTTKAGFNINENMIKRIFYDARFSRARDNGERLRRYEYADELRDFWESDRIIGTGIYHHGFWLPNISGWL